MSILAKIKQRPDNQKKLFSLTTAVILTFIIVIIWLSFSGDSSDNQLATGEKVNKLSSISPIQVIKDEFSKVFSSFKNNIQANPSGSSTIPIEIVSEEVASSSTVITEGTSTSSASTSPGIREINSLDENSR